MVVVVVALYHSRVLVMIIIITANTTILFIKTFRNIVFKEITIHQRPTALNMRTNKKIEIGILLGLFTWFFLLMNVSNHNQTLFLYWENDKSDRLPLVYQNTLLSMVKTFGRENIVIASRTLDVTKHPVWFPRVWNSYYEELFHGNKLVDQIESTSQFKHVHMADLFRLVVLYKLGGIYSDMDALWVNKPRLSTFLVMGYDNTYISNGCMAFEEPNSPFLAEVISLASKTYNPSCWNCLGSKVLQEIFVKRAIPTIPYLQMYGVFWKDSPQKELINKYKNGEIHQLHLFGKNLRENVFDDKESIYSQLLDWVVNTKT